MYSSLDYEKLWKTYLKISYGYARNILTHFKRLSTYNDYLKEMCYDGLCQEKY